MAANAKMYSDLKKGGIIVYHCEYTDGTMGMFVGKVVHIERTGVTERSSATSVLVIKYKSQFKDNDKKWIDGRKYRMGNRSTESVQVEDIISVFSCLDNRNYLPQPIKEILKKTEAYQRMTPCVLNAMRYVWCSFIDPAVCVEVSGQDLCAIM